MTVTSNPIRTIERKAALESCYTAFYRHEQGCRFFEHCSDGLVDKFPNGYRFSKTVSLGVHYDLTIDGLDVRILFIGKEGRSGRNALRQPARLTDFREEKKVNLHYRETYKMLCEMLGYNYENGKLKDHSKFLCKPDANLACYALTNLYRCAFKQHDSDVKSIPNTKAQTANCLTILREELRILEPTVIILQKADLRAVHIAPDAIVVEKACGLYVSESLQAYLIETSHPSNFGKWYRESKPRFSRAVNALRARGALPAQGSDTTDLLNTLVNT